MMRRAATLCLSVSRRRLFSHALFSRCGRVRRARGRPPGRKKPQAANFRLSKFRNRCNGKNMKNDSGMMVAVRVSLICNVILFVIKLITLLIVNSLAVAADLGISVVALGVSGILYYAIRMSSKPADLLHNYGYGKVENVTEAIEGVVLIGLALAMSVQAVLSLIRPGAGVHSPFVGLAASLIGVI